MLFNLCVGLLLAAYLLRGVRRFERRADALMAKFVERHLAISAKLERNHQEEMRRFDIAREEIKASMRARVDRAIAEMEANAAHCLPAPARVDTNSANGAHNGIALHPDHPEASSFGS
jgi:hypothetical protein